MTMLSIEPQHSNEHWTRIAARAPVLAATCQDYVAQIVVTARPSTAKAVDSALRILSDWLIDHDPTVIAFRQINRRHIEAFKLWLATRQNQRGEPLKKSTIHLRLSILRVGSSDSSNGTIPTPLCGTRSCGPTCPNSTSRCRSSSTTTKPPSSWLPPRDSIRNADSWSRCWRAPGCASPSSASSPHDAIVKMNETNWLRVPVGKLHTDRYVPLHPVTHRTAPRLARLERPEHDRSTHLEQGPAAQPNQRQPHRETLRDHRRDRPRPPPPTAPHLGDTINQQRHEPRSRLRDVGPPIDAHDPRLRPHRRPHHRRRILRRRRQSRPALHHPLDNITGIRADMSGLSATIDREPGCGYRAPSSGPSTAWLTGTFEIVARPGIVGAV